MAATNRFVAPFRARAPGADHPAAPTEIDAALAERLLVLALERGGDWADLFFEYRVGASYVLEDEKVKAVGRGVTLGLGVRVLAGEATGYAYCEELTWEAMAQAAKTAAQIALSGKAGHHKAVAPVAVAGFYPVQIASVETVPEAKLELLRRADRAARAVDPKIVKVEASFVEEWKEILVVTSDGKMARDEQPLLRFGCHALAEVGGKRQGGSSGGGGRYGMEYFDTHSPEAHGKEAARIALAMLDAVDAPAGTMEVVLAPGDSGILLHEAVGHGLEADFNRKGTSNYTGRVGQRVASDKVTVIDDGTIAGSRGAINVDDEGNLPQKNTLIENGMLVGYMQDQLSTMHQGGHTEGRTSGNGRRQSFRHNPLPRMTNTLMGVGTDDPEEIIRSTKRGIYAKRFSGGQVDISNGDFVFSLTESYLIEDGKITAPLKGVNLIGNGPDVLTKVTHVGHDFALSDGIWTCGKDGQSVPVGVGTPTVKIAAITVGGTKA